MKFLQKFSGSLWAMLAVGLFAVVLQACLNGEDTAPPGNPPDGDTLTWRDSLSHGDSLERAQHERAELFNLEGESQFRTGQYGKAMASFDSAIRLDSTFSAAYYGYAKATVSYYGINKLAILQDFEVTASDPSAFAFLQHSDSMLTARLQVASKVLVRLRLLADRDSLTQWHHYLTDSVPSAAALADPLYEQRRLFMQNYLIKADLGMPGYRKNEKFPLSDFRQQASNLRTDHTAFELMYTITRLYDFDRNDTIDARDALMKNLNFGGGGFSIDSLSGIAGDLEGDSTAAGNLNALIAAMQSGLLTSAQLAALMGGGSDTVGSEAEVSGNLDSIITGLGDAVLFYQFGDKLDNDGDGCIDEEIMDDKDNDLDGYVDEDARVVSADKPDNVDNDRNGKKDPLNPPFPFAPGNDSLEAPVGSIAYPMRPHVLGFVYAFMDATDRAETDDNKIDWVKIKKGAEIARLQVRLNIQKDSLAVRIPIGGPVPDSLKARLADAKAQVGGCWRQYP